MDNGQERTGKLCSPFCPLLSRLQRLLRCLIALCSQLFGASAVTKEYVLGVTDYSRATWTQNFIASVVGAVASITIAAPLDTVKTRIQNATFEHKVPGVVVIKDLLKNEGPTAFFKGLTPKVSLDRHRARHTKSYHDRFSWSGQNWCSALRSALSYTLAQSLISYFSKYV
jgi:hypothetical protein